MSVLTAATGSAVSRRADVPNELIWRLTVAQYHDMMRAGVLTEDDPVELLDGWLVYKMPKNPPHRLATELSREALARLLTPGWHVESQEPITTPTSEPEPDLSVVRGERRQYATCHPGPADLGLVGEVADTTLERDRGTKKRLYAQAGIPVYWIVSLVDRQVEVYTGPSGPAEEPDYRQRRDYGPDEEVPVVIDGQLLGGLRVRDLLP